MTLVPHTHWDREWYEPFDAFLERLVAMMDTLLELAEAGFPHFHLDGQTAMVDDYLAVRPERLADVQRLAGLGRLSIGPWVTQMDEFLTSGESHLRNLEMGLARARELGGGLEIGYLPDQFGHVGQMPQILRTAGISRAVVWRGVPGAVDRSVFRWEAPDGSVVLTEYLAFGYFLGADLHTFRTPEALADALRRKVEQIRPFLATDDVLVMVGSDHAGPDATLPDRLTAAEPLFPEAGARVGSLEDHLDGPQPEDVPTWRGELRSSARAHLLPNVYSARAHQKRERGRVEALVERSAEPLAALVEGFAWPQERLDRIWTLLLWNGAHDSACGCSHDRVASDVDGRFAEARGLAEAIVEEALAALGEQVAEGGTIRFNPCPFARDGVPGLGWRVDPAPPPVEWDAVEVAVAEGGWIAVDDRLRLTLLDEPDVGDLYNFCFADEDQVPDRPELRNSRGEVEARWRDLTVRLVVRRRVGERVYRLEGAIENARPDHRLRLCVALPESVNGSVAGSPFELVARPLRSEGSDLEAPSATWPARHVVLAGEVAAYHEGVFEYEVSGPELFVTLLRSVGTISRERLATRPWPAGPDVPTPDAQMIGTTRFSLGLEPDAGRDRLLPTWERFALPLSEAIARGGGELAATGSLLEISGDAVLSSVRRRAGAVEVRLWNPRADAPADATIAGRDVRLGPARIETFPAA
jgi:alpha-mannosidase